MDIDRGRERYRPGGHRGPMEPCGLIKDGVQATIVMGAPALVAHAVAGIDG